MTRLWLPMGRRVLLLIAFLIALVLLLPMRLAVGALGLDDGAVGARGVRGPVWAATFDDLRVGGVSLGQVDASLSPFALLLGRARVDVARRAGDPLSGAITVSRNAVGIDGLTTTLPLGAALAPLPIAAIEFAGFGVRFVDDACLRAGGTARARLSSSIAGVALAQGLSGPATCDGRHLRLALASQSGQERLDLRIARDGGYIADLIAVEPAADRAGALGAMGFAAVPGGYRLRVTGRLR